MKNLMMILVFVLSFNQAFGVEVEVRGSQITGRVTDLFSGNKLKVQLNDNPPIELRNGKFNFGAQILKVNLGSQNTTRLLDLPTNQNCTLFNGFNLLQGSSTFTLDNKGKLVLPPPLNITCEKISGLNGVKISGTVDGLNPGEELKLQFNSFPAITVSTNKFTFKGQTLQSKVRGNNSLVISEQPKNQLCGFAAVPRPPVTISFPLFELIRAQNGRPIFPEEFRSLSPKPFALSCSNTFTASISGSVTGLEGSLSLGFSNGKTFEINTDRPFSFQHKGLPGTAFSVSIIRQPSFQNCTVENGSGRIQDQDLEVNNAIVNCVNKTFPVSGKVSGMRLFPFLNDPNLKPLILSNGFEEFTIARKPSNHDNVNRNITFPTPIQFRKQIELSIAQQPIGQTCRLVNGKNYTVIESNQNAFEVECTTNQVGQGGTISGLIDPVNIEYINDAGTTFVESFAQNGNFTLEQKFAFDSLIRVKFSGPSNNSGSIIKTGRQNCQLFKNDLVKRGLIESSATARLSIICTDTRPRLTIDVLGLTGALTLGNGDKLRTITNDANDQGTAKPNIADFGQFDEGTPFEIAILSNPPGQICKGSPLNGLVADTFQTFVKGIGQPVNPDVSISCFSIPTLVTLPPAEGRLEVLYDYTPRLQLPPGGTIGRAQFTLSGKPSWATFDANTGRLLGFPDVGGSFENIQYSTRINGEPIPSLTFSFSIQVASDPLAAQSWHLDNTGQTSFSTLAGGNFESAFTIAFPNLFKKQDMSLLPTLKAGITGRGVKVGIIGQGLDKEHEDLKENIQSDRSVDYRIEKSQLPVFNATSTHIAGVIAAVGWNNKGGRGVAPEASLLDLNALSPEVPESSKLSALADAYQRELDISVTSQIDLDLKTSVKFTNTKPEIFNALSNSIAFGRQGLGTIHLVPSGLELGYFSGIDTAYNHLANLPFVMGIGSINAYGAPTSGSQIGSNIWVSGLGGELGYTPTAKNPMTEFPVIPLLGGNLLFSPSIISTDPSGCEKGDSRRSETSRSLFNFDTELNEVHLANPDCNYTSTTPHPEGSVGTVAGVVALMLKANPQLSWRDVKHILARTARPYQTKPGNITSAIIRFQKNGKGQNYPANDTPQSGIRNKAGFDFDNRKGFGRVNADRAVNVASTNYQSPFKDKPLISTSHADGAFKYSSGELNQVIGESRITTIASSGAVSNTTNSTIQVPDALTIEAVQIEVSLDHPHIGELGLMLVNRTTGTTSIVLTPGGLDPFENNQVIPNLKSQVFLSNAFYLESSAGAWDLRILNTGVPGTAGTLKNWKLNFYGHQK